MGLEKRVLVLVGELIGLAGLDEFSHALLRGLRETMPSDFSALNEVPAELPHTISLTDPPVPAEIHERFARYAAQNPIVQYFQRMGDGRATRISDLITRRELHQLELYRQVYAPLGVEFQIAFTLPSRGGGRILGATLSRGARDFSARERDLLNLARPYLIELYRSALAQSMLDIDPKLTLPALQGLGLTRREAQVLRLIAAGRTGRQVATQLGIAQRTVHKHLENCYRALNVTSSAEAVRVVAEAAGRV